MSRRVAPVAFPVGLTIAGSDSGGGAGIQADLKTMEAHAVFGTSAITAVTAQNTRGVHSSHVLPTREIEAQIDAVLSDFEVGAVKTGMLATVDVIETVADALSDRDLPTVVDPVMVAATGDRLLEPEAEDAYEALLAETTLVTPNTDEAAVLTGIEPVDEESAIEAGDALCEMGADAALVKGGHMPTEDVLDVLVTEGAIGTYRHARIETEATHGSGCTLSAAIAARLARGESLSESVSSALAFMERAVRYPVDVGSGPGPVHHLVELRDRAERATTAETVSWLVDRFLDLDRTRLASEGGVVGATPYAETVSDTAGATLARDGSETGGRAVQYGLACHTVDHLLLAREGETTVRFAATVARDERVEDRLQSLDGAVVNLADPRRPPRDAFDSAAVALAVYDRSESGEPTATVLAPDAETLVERVGIVLDARR
ncbi:bifunctional hydroxymethylpyrimidine kinase/phosphomethylpyrimidine kinase [Natronorarus salvus]|uniref:bifunctional hydroxymethylpyrimidine kinase/phosphomethylpyrimidine kinase n=1 Tax=Natronorarus salvus TaxID=3117733 RepID=UPI002F26A494